MPSPMYVRKVLMPAALDEDVIVLSPVMLKMMTAYNRNIGVR
jgi:hypothetical protein